jgi:cysteine synthase
MDALSPEAQARVQRAARACGKRNVTLPTFAELREGPGFDPSSVSEFDAKNIFRCSWRKKKGDDVNTVEIPAGLLHPGKGSEKSGFRVVCMVGSHMPTGAHKVGPAYTCLVAKIVKGELEIADPDASAADTEKFPPSVVVWPSTGNFCRGGAMMANLLGCKALAVLPEDMSDERFEWLERVGAEVIKTPGGESNVREIYDECRAIDKARANVVVVNQFAEFGNSLFHYSVTGEAVLDALEEQYSVPREAKSESANSNRLFAYVSATGSAGTIATGDKLKEVHDRCKIVASEALQCPTMYENGFGSHRVEGIGDKHIPWIHNIRNTDVVVSADDEHAMSLLRLFHEPVGQQYLRETGVVPEDFQFELFGISGLHNVVSAVKAARTLGAGDGDILVTQLTDSGAMYQSRVAEMRDARGPYTREQAAVDLAVHFHALDSDHVLDLNLAARRRIHNLKYFTWIEQQGFDVSDLNRQWEDRDYWRTQLNRADEYDVLIREFNRIAATTE